MWYTLFCVPFLHLTPRMYVHIYMQRWIAWILAVCSTVSSWASAGKCLVDVPTQPSWLWLRSSTRLRCYSVHLCELLLAHLLFPFFPFCELTASGGLCIVAAWSGSAVVGLIPRDGMGLTHGMSPTTADPDQVATIQRPPLADLRKVVNCSQPQCGAPYAPGAQDGS